VKGNFVSASNDYVYVHMIIFCRFDRICIHYVKDAVDIVLGTY